MSEFKRTDRVAEAIQRKLAELIQQEIKDPRLPPFITISAVKLAADLAHAKVYFTALNADIELTTQILNTAAGFLRKSLASSMKTRTVPQLHFVYDESIEYGRHLSRLIDEVNKTDDDNKDGQSN